MISCSVSALKGALFLVVALLCNAVLLLAQPVNDSRVNAIDLSHTSLWTSADAAYTNVGATGKGFNEEPNVEHNNVWFKFQATTNEIDFRVLTGGAKGTLSSIRIKLYNNVGSLQSTVDTWSTTGVIQFIALTPGSVYYVSVDNLNNSVGSFSLQINDQVGHDMRAKATLLTQPLLVLCAGLVGKLTNKHAQ